MLRFRHASTNDVATWFNLTVITSEIEDRWYPAKGGPLVLFAAALYTVQGVGSASSYARPL